MRSDPSTLPRWTDLSPIQRQLNRHRMHRAAAYAAARALEQAASMAYKGRERLAVRARRLTACASSHSVLAVTEPGEATRLVFSHNRSCKDVLCCICLRKRAATMRKKAVELLAGVREIAPGAPVVMLTLTSRNRPLSQLAAQLDEHEAALQRLTRSSAFGRSCLGLFTATEIVIRGTTDAPQAGAHSHSIAVMRPEYRPGADIYLRQPDFVRLWRQALRINYHPIVDVRLLRGPDGATDADSVDRAAKEIAKYILKPASLFKRGAFGVSADPEIVAILADALYRRRQVRYGGIFFRAAKLRRTQSGQTSSEVCE